MPVHHYVIIAILILLFIIVLYIMNRMISHTRTIDALERTVVECTQQIQYMKNTPDNIYLNNSSTTTTITTPNTQSTQTVQENAEQPNDQQDQKENDPPLTHTDTILIEGVIIPTTDHTTTTPKLDIHAVFGSDVHGG